MRCGPIPSMMDIFYGALVVGGAVSITALVVAGTMEGNWWRLFLLLVLWPLGTAAKAFWHRHFKSEPRQDDPTPDGQV